jgi:organic anion transporter 2B/organic anion transporter 3A
MTPNDPRWIGAWWLGFLVFGSLALIPSILVLFFPRTMSKPEDKESEDQPQDKESKSTDNSILDLIKGKFGINNFKIIYVI